MDAAPPTPRPLRALALSALLAGLAAPATAQEPRDLDWYLPDGVTYDAEFPKPASVLGWEVGTWHVRHDQLVRWFERVAEASPRVRLETYGHTYEQRPLLLAAVSSPANIERLEELRAAHVGAVLSGAEDHDGPQVVWMGYSVHGNESSGANAALLFAYHLAAAQGEEIETFLDSTIVLIDPCLNPDGLSRFAHWANTHRGANLVGDPSHREHREAWPGGRTNHYWFDLNRDWLLLTHPESRGRLAKFHGWMPSVLTDYHEMGSDSTYFFQPGIPSRQNPLTPERNLDLTRLIAQRHADALDGIGSLYYTEESFDDFYYGKGSTYPDLQGCVGILFEQASSRGHLQENSFGGIDFPFTIKNQFTTSLSTLRAAWELRDELTSWQRSFFATAREEAAEHPIKAYVFGANEDPARTARLADLLTRHGIAVHRLARELAAPASAPESARRAAALGGGPSPEAEDAQAGAAMVPERGPMARAEADDSEVKATFAPETSFLVRLDQPQFRLIRALFETRTSWPDNTFYDVSSWTMPLAFDVPYLALGADFHIDGLAGDPWDGESPAPAVIAAERPVAWAFEWRHEGSPRALQRLLAAGVRARVATEPLYTMTEAGELELARGTVVVPTGIQDLPADEVDELVLEAVADGVDVVAVTSGLTSRGVDLGSGSLRPLEEPKPLMLVGSGVSGYDAGEVWHHLDQRVGVALSMVEKDSLGGLDLDRYTHVIAVSGATGWDERETEAVRDWVRGGGVLIALESSAVRLAGDMLGRADEEEKSKKKEEEESGSADDEAAPPVYGDYRDLAAVHRIAGTIFEARLDLTHPLCFGFVRDRIPVFRNSTSLLPEGGDPFAAPVRYTAEPLLSGYASPENVAKIASSPAIRAERVGRGTVVCLVDDPLFRGVWHGTSRFFANALYFSKAIYRTGPIDVPGHDESHGDEHGHDHGPDY